MESPLPTSFISPIPNRNNFFSSIGLVTDTSSPSAEASSAVTPALGVPAVPSVLCSPGGAAQTVYFTDGLRLSSARASALRCQAFFPGVEEVSSGEQGRAGFCVRNNESVCDQERARKTLRRNSCSSFV